MADLPRMPSCEAEKLRNVRHFFWPSIRKYMYVCAFVPGSLSRAARDRQVSFTVENRLEKPSSLKSHYRTAVLTCCGCCHRSFKLTTDLEAEKSGRDGRPLWRSRSIDHDRMNG